MHLIFVMMLIAVAFVPVMVVTGLPGTVCFINVSADIRRFEAPYLVAVCKSVTRRLVIFSL